MKTKRLVLCVLALALVLSACGGGGGGAGDAPLVLRLASDAPLDHIASVLNQMAADLVYERTEGRVQVQYFPASQLGGYETVYEELMMGSIDVAQITLPDALDPRLGLGYVPYMAVGFDQAKEFFARDGWISQMKAEITAQHGVRFLGWVLEGFIGMGMIDLPENVFEPGAPKGTGFRMRSPTLVAFRLVQEDLGYNIVTVPYAEVPVAMQTRVVDGWIGGTPNMNYAWLSDLITRMYINYLHAEATSFVMSELSIERIPEQDRQAVLDAFMEISDYSFIHAQTNEDYFKQRLRDAGVEVIYFPPDVLAANVEFVRNTTWPRLEHYFGVDVMDQIRAEVERLFG